METSLREVLAFATVFFLLACAIFTTRLGPSKKADSSAPENTSQESSRVLMASLYVSIWPMDHDIETIPPGAAMRLFDEIQKFGKSHVESFGGFFESASMTSFFGHWPIDKTAELAQCVLKLRQDYSTMNGLRKNDGFEVIPMVFGAASGQVLRVTGESGVRVLGEAMSSARELASRAVKAETDFLVSKEVWDLIGNFAEGSCRVEGYGSEARYMVNNGSQIVGPLRVTEIAQQLYCMDLDFDCECWIEGRGDRTTIGGSGIFGGSESPDARFWVFDGKNLHGPMTEGFLKTAVSHGVMDPDSFFCADSTALGWKRLVERAAA